MCRDKGLRIRQVSGRPHGCIVWFDTPGARFLSFATAPDYWFTELVIYGQHKGGEVVVLKHYLSHQTNPIHLQDIVPLLEYLPLRCEFINRGAGAEVGFIIGEHIIEEYYEN
jgi:hypothetical protein